MTNTDTGLTQKQAYYLKRFQEAQDRGLSLRQIAEQEQVKLSLLCNYRYVLRRKGVLGPAGPARRRLKPNTPSFTAVPLSSSADPKTKATIELKTQLANGQPVWMNIPAGQLGAVLAALSA